jgi:phosphohistidine phosphatase
MKTLLLLRHAKSSWKDPRLADFDRPLNRRGLRDAPRMGNLLRRLELVPEQIVCSTARRARHTAELVAEACGFDGAWTFLDALYHASPAAYVHALRGVSPPDERVLLVGHNPEMQEALYRWTGQDESFPTCALAQLEFAIDDWSQLAEQPQAMLRGLWRPKEL